MPFSTITAILCSAFSQNLREKLHQQVDPNIMAATARALYDHWAKIKMHTQVYEMYRASPFMSVSEFICVDKQSDIEKPSSTYTGSLCCIRLNVYIHIIMKSIAALTFSD